MRKKKASTTIIPIRLPENGDVPKQLVEMAKRQKELRKLLEGQEVRFEDAIKCFNSSKEKTKRLDVSLSTEVSSSKLGNAMGMYAKEQKLQAHLAQDIKSQRLQIEKIKQDIKRVNMEHLSLRGNLKDEVAVFKSPDSNSRRPPLARTLSDRTPSSA